MIKKYCSLIFIYYLLIFCTFSCQELPNKEAVKAVEKSTKKLRFVRFETEVLKLKGTNDNNNIINFNKHYFGFFDLFNTGIIRIGKSTSNGYNERLQDFLSDKYIQQIYNCTDSVYSNIIPLEEDLNESFKYYNYYFPSKKVPSIFTFVSGFNCAIAPTDSILAIGLDYFLGSTRNYYSLLDFPEYQKRKLTPNYVASTAMLQWIRTEFEADSVDNTLLGAIIQEGKSYYVLKQCMPEKNDTILFGFTSKQLGWVNDSEFEIWSFLLDKKLLYNTNPTEYNRYIADGPFTPGMPRESPARATNWLGYKIIESFMNNNKNMTLQKLLQLKSAQTILNKSKYKPHK
jgi:hypothetical protein